MFGRLGIGAMILALGVTRPLETRAPDGDEEPDRGSVPAPEAPEPDPPVDLPREEEVAGGGAEESDVADPDRYKRGPGW